MKSNEYIQLSNRDLNSQEQKATYRAQSETFLEALEFVSTAQSLQCNVVMLFRRISQDYTTMLSVR